MVMNLTFDISMDDASFMHVFQRYCELTRNRNDETFFQTCPTRSSFHQSVHTTTWTVVANNPKLGVKIEGLLDVVDILRPAILEML